MTSRLKICIDARASEGTAGGSQRFVHGLLSGLASLPDGDEEYVVLVDGAASRWLPRVPEDWRIESVPTTSTSHTLAAALKTYLLRGMADRVFDIGSDLPILCKALPPQLPESNGVVEGLGVDLIHFPTQDAFLTHVPSVYHPHDLQHLHLPQFFSRRASFLRERAYRKFCAQARMVAVASTWTRDDVVNRYGLPPDNVQVVPLAPATASYTLAVEDDPDAFVRERRLPSAFVLYPAQTWPHKNHLALLEALALLRARGLTIPLVCSGHLNAFHATIERRAHALGLATDVHFVGFVTAPELQVLYRACRAVLIPSLFEAASFPLWEAFRAGAPAACSNVTSLPAQAGDAALVFDPRDPRAIADAVQRLWTDEALRRELVERGRRNVARFTWERTARHFRAHYRRITGRSVTPQDLALLAEPPLL